MYVNLWDVNDWPFCLYILCIDSCWRHTGKIHTRLLFIQKIDISNYKSYTVFSFLSVYATCQNKTRYYNLSKLLNQIPRQTAIHFHKLFSHSHLTQDVTLHQVHLSLFLVLFLTALLSASKSRETASLASSTSAVGGDGFSSSGYGESSLLSKSESRLVIRYLDVYLLPGDNRVRDQDPRCLWGGWLD